MKINEVEKVNRLKLELFITGIKLIKKRVFFQKSKQNENWGILSIFISSVEEKIKTQ